MRNVASNRPYKSHVFSRQSYHCEIRDNSFIDATSHGNGGRGYGTNLANATTACLVQDNVLVLLRHLIVMHVGANDNVIARIHLGDAGPIGAENTVLRNGFTSGPLTVENAPLTQVLVGNWYNGRRWTDGVADTAGLMIPDSLYGNSQPILSGQISGQWQTDCAIPALKRALGGGS